MPLQNDWIGHFVFASVQTGSGGMHSKITFADVANDPCAIIARSTCGTVMFFASYGVLAYADVSTLTGFWLSLYLGMVGCFIPGHKPDPRFLLPLALIALPAARLAAHAIGGGA